MSYKTYDAYETIDNSFLKQMPKDWEMFKLKFLINTLESGKRKDFENETFAFSIGGEHINWNGTLNLKNERYVSEDFYNSMSKGKICKNDTLLVKDGATIGKTAFVDNLPQKMAVNEHVFILRSNKLLNPKLLYYLIFSNLGFTQIKLTETGSAQGGISQNIADKVEFIIPINLNHQQQIVDYLDKQTAKIDETISKNEELIKLLEEKRVALINLVVTKGLNPDVPMKDSGVEWIGEIPEHWNINKIKKYFNIYNGSTPKNNEENWNGNIHWITPADYKTTDIYINNSSRKITKNGLNSCGTTLVPKGSIIVSNRAPIGTVAIANVDLCTNQGCKSLAIKRNINTKFVYYVLSINEKELNKLGRGTTFMELSAYDLGTFPIPIAPDSEQKDIVNYLDKETSKINQTVSKIKENIKLLEEYKTSLIHNVVTGKIDVREEVV